MAESQVPVVSTNLHFSVKLDGTPDLGWRLTHYVHPAYQPDRGTAWPLMTEKSELLREIDETTGPEDMDIDEARLRQQAIGVKLRHMFDEVVNEPIPNDFLEILRRADLRANEGGS